MAGHRITLEDVESLRDVHPKRRRFSDNPVVYKRTDERHIASTVFPSIDQLFQAETGIATREGPYGPYRFLGNDAEIKKATEWQESRSGLIFLRDMLDSSIALDFNLAEAGVYTGLGLAENNAKAGKDEAALRILCKALRAVIDDIKFYKQCDAVCAVPPAPGKAWDLPTELAGRVAKKCSKLDISSMVQFTQKKGSVKAVSLEEKWGTLEKGKLTVDARVKGKRIILIDDKYQSGTTAQFTASKLYGAGAAEVHGLFCIKTWRDTDNT